MSALIINISLPKNKWDFVYLSLLRKVFLSWMNMAMLVWHVFFLFSFCFVSQHLLCLQVCDIHSHCMQECPIYSFSSRFSETQITRELNSFAASPNLLYSLTAFTSFSHFVKSGYQIVSYDLSFSSLIHYSAFSW